MLGRLFGRSKDENDDTICSACGRTLLAGEWTQRVVEDDGSERFICALCARADAAPGPSFEPADDIATVTPGRVRPARADSDAFWRALKDKDAEIERLESLLARAEAEKEELAAQLARVRGEATAAGNGSAKDGEPAAGERASVPDVVGLPVAAPEAGADTAEFKAADVGSQTAEYTPADLAEIGALDAPAFGAAVTDRPADVPGVSPFDDPAFLAASASGDQPSHADEERHADEEALGDEERHADEEALGDVERHADEERFVLVGPEGAAGSSAGADSGGGEFVPLTILQRGVDLLNVSAVPKRVVETNENLGIPQVHVGSENDSTLLITFMWSMGWYQFRVELEGAGRITLADRGYEERVDLRPNASARSDGTVQLASSQIKPPTPKDTSAARTTGVTRGVIISKSMKGQRTDDENVPADWKSKRAPDFDWGR